jgi:hypothetical protein
MSGTIEYFTEIIDCKECGKNNIVNVISEYDNNTNETFNSIVVGQKCCDCKSELTSF